MMTPIRRYESDPKYYDREVLEALKTPEGYWYESNKGLAVLRSEDFLPVDFVPTFKLETAAELGPGALRRAYNRCIQKQTSIEAALAKAVSMMVGFLPEDRAQALQAFYTETLAGLPWRKSSPS